MLKGALGEPIPEEPHIPFYLIEVECGKLGGLLLEVTAEPRIGAEEAKHLGIVLDPPIPFGGNSPDDIHPARDKCIRRSQPVNDRPRRERVLAQIDDVGIELGPGIVPGNDIHRPVIIEKMEREGEDAAITLILEIERSSLSER